MVTTVATVADTLEEHFLQYYDRFMPLLKYLMANSVQKENRLLRGKTIECISLIGLAVGKDKVSTLCPYCYPSQPHPLTVHAGCSRSDAASSKSSDRAGGGAGGR